MPASMIFGKFSMINVSSVFKTFGSAADSFGIALIMPSVSEIRMLIPVSRIFGNQSLNMPVTLSIRLFIVF